MLKRTLTEVQRLTRRHGTKARISRNTGIAPPYLSRILKGERIPSEAKAALLERELGIPASDWRRA